MSDQQNWGASPDDWAVLADLAGLTGDLLPVVSNQGARIDPDSKLKGLGKIPSLYNAHGMAVGIAKWPEKVSTPRDVTRWQAQPDYGICIITRTVRALDIDIGDDAFARGVAAARLPGRLQRFERDGVEVRVDVGHNPQAARELVAWLRARPIAGRTHAVYAALGDKDAQAVVAAFDDVVDDWWLAGTRDAGARGLYLHSRRIYPRGRGAVRRRGRGL